MRLYITLSSDDIRKSREGLVPVEVPIRGKTKQYRGVRYKCMNAAMKILMDSLKESGMKDTKNVTFTHVKSGNKRNKTQLMRDFKKFGNGRTLQEFVKAEYTVGNQAGSNGDETGSDRNKETKKYRIKNHENATRKIETERATAVADKLLAEISRVEPKITTELQSIAKSAGATMVGLEFRVKEADSLTRKILTYAADDGISLEEAGNKINDALRYTMLFDSDNFYSQYSNVKDKLIKSGYNIKRVKNSWSDGSAYKGINVVIEKDGQKMEMQYHTQESFELESGELHKLYEKRRLPETTEEERAKLDSKMVELSGRLKTPKGVGRCK